MSAISVSTIFCPVNFHTWPIHGVKFVGVTFLWDSISLQTEAIPHK